MIRSLPHSPGRVFLLALAMIVCLGIPTLVAAEVKLPALFSDHMVLQRDSRIAVWGWADAGEEITVMFGGQIAMTKADEDGRWRVALNNMAANATPQILTVKGKNTIQFNDVLVGDVWVCSGQSNMGVKVGETTNAGDVLRTAHDPLLRLFRVREHVSLQPEEDAKPSWDGKKWVVSDPEVVQVFTAVGYFFGRELRSDLHVPIGLIESDQGGSKAQLWTSVSAIEKNIDADPEFKVWLKQRKEVVDAYPQKMAEYLPQKKIYDEAMKHWRAEVWDAPEFTAKRAQWEIDNDNARKEGKPPLPRLQPSVPSPIEPPPPNGGPYSNFMVGTLYNAMIAPLTSFSIKGVVWYQGESNESNSRQYGVLFPIMITDWREKWGEGDFPFIFVQLPNIKKPATQPVQSNDPWPGMREAQAKALSLPNTGMAITIDVGDPYNVHGKDKFDVGYRLALVARHTVYKEKIVYTGPTYDSMKVKKGQIELTFKNQGGGLMIGAAPWTPSGKIPLVESNLKGFAIAGEDQRWFFAKAQIKHNHVFVSSVDVPHPVAVRYGWADNPPCNLYNREKLPAAPFRTDKW